MGWIDTTVVLVVMFAVTWLGHYLSGAANTRASFFRADGTLPWWAVSASIIATLVSAVTFVSVPAAIFAPGGDLSYLQVIAGLALGKLAIAALLVKAFYQEPDAATSYGYIAKRIDPVTGELSMGLGLILNLINSGVKVLAASVVLDVITGWGVPVCAAVVVLVSVFWSALAGVKTVIWTDFILFVLFCLGAVFTLVFIIFSVETPVLQAVAQLDQQARLVWLDISLDPTVRYTLFSCLVGGVALNIAQASTQGTWQRVKACRSLADAYRAYNFAAAFYVVHLVIMAVGLALVIFYSEFPLAASVVQRLAEQPDVIFPHFILTEMPVGLSGLFIAAIFAAAISTLDSALAEASDISLHHIYERLVPGRSEGHYVLSARLLMVFWGIVFWVITLFFAGYSSQGLLDLTFKFPNYVLGGLFGSIVLARLGVGRWQTVLFGLCIAAGITLWLAASQVAFFWWCPVSGIAMVAAVYLLEAALPSRTTAPLAGG